jgi:hypothetical protein
LYFKVFQVTRGAEELVCNGGAADVVGQMRLKLVFLGDAGVDVAASSYMQLSHEGFRIEKEKKWGEGLSLDRASLLVFDLCRPLREA